MLCIVSMIRYDTYSRYIDPIHDTYRDTYRIIYSIKNIAKTVIKTQHTNTCMHKICAVNRSHQPRCNISNRTFQKLPLVFRAGQFVDNTV